MRLKLSKIKAREIKSAKDLKKERIAIIYGGNTTERETSVMMMRHLFFILKKIGLNAFPIYFDKNFIRNLKKNRITLAMVEVSLKTYKEGSIEGILNMLDIPHTGHSTLAASLCLNKYFAKKIWESDGLKTPKYIKTEYGQNPNLINQKLKKNIIDFPVIVKPLNEGAGFGVSIAKTPKDLKAAIKKAKFYDKELLIEEFISGREITCAVLGKNAPRALGVIELKKRDLIWNSKDKFIGGPNIIKKIPMNKDNKFCKKIQELSVKAFRSLGCNGLARVDFIVKNKTPYLIEINAIPGITGGPTNKSAELSGISEAELLVQILKLAKEK